VALDGRLFLGAVGGFGLMTLMFGLSTHFPLSLIALALLGGLDSISVVIRQTVIQQATPDALRGRVAAVNRVFISSSNELGALESGLLAAAVGPVLAVAGGGVLTLLVVAASPSLFPELSHWRRPQRP
jgi:predicted MFS family arabinose efflux permease